MNRPASTLHVRPETFDDPDFPLGILRTAPDRTVLYLNRALDDMLGGQLRVGQDISTLAFDEPSRAALQAALAARFEHERGTGYSVQIARADTGTLVRARVAMVPEYDAQGRLRSAVGCVADESMEAVSMAMHRAMDRATEPRVLLAEASASLREVLRFDALMVTALSRDGLHLRTLFEAPAPDASTRPYRWWPMPPFVQAMVREYTPGPLDLDALFARPDYAALATTDLALQDFISRGFHHSLRLRVESRGAQVAIVSLLRRDGPAFSDADLGLCQRLPLVEAVSWALALEQQDEQRFSLELIGELAALADDAPAAQQRLVDALWERFHWDHVSLFRAAVHRGRLHLVCQAAGAPAQLPAGYEQSLDTGLLGRAFHTGQVVNAPRVADERDHESGGLALRSELVMPLPGRDTTWLLNIESVQDAAFAEEERQAVDKLLRVAALVIERSALVGLQTAIHDKLADMVIRTDRDNTIIDINRAGEGFLGLARTAIIGRLLTSFVELEDDEAPGDDNDDWRTPTVTTSGANGSAHDVLFSTDRASGVMQFRSGDGSLVRMLVSMSSLPGAFGGKVFVASDLTGPEYRDSVTALAPRLRQVASEMRTPLALAYSFLDDADEGSDPLEMIGKAMVQIGKADVSLERVMRLAAITEEGPLPMSAFELRSVLSSIEEELPRETQQHLRLTMGSDSVVARAAFEPLRHCVQSLLARLLALRSERELIEVKVGQAGAGRAYLALRLNDTGAREMRTRPDLLLHRDVEPVVGALLHRMGGQFKADATRLRYLLVVKAEA